MAAIVSIQELNGTGPTYTDVTSIRFCNADNYNPGLDYPCVVPKSGFSYSFWKSLVLDISGTFTRVNNVRLYSDGAIGWTLGTGGALRLAVHPNGDMGVDTYQQSAGNIDSGNAIEDPTNGHQGYIAAGTAWAASTAYSAGDVVHPTTLNGYVYECTTAGTSGTTEPTWPTTPGDTVTDGGVTWTCRAVVANIEDYTDSSPALIDSTNHDAPEKTKIAVLQVKIAPDAAHGAQSAETLTFIYDEI